MSSEIPHNMYNDMCLWQQIRKSGFPALPGDSTLKSPLTPAPPTPTPNLLAGLHAIRP